MVKKLCMACLLMTPLMANVDWLEDIAVSCAQGNTLDRSKALNIIAGYIKKDQDEHANLKKDAQKNDQAGGILPGIRKVSDNAEMALVNRKLGNHKEIESIIKGLAHDKKLERSFTTSLKKLSNYVHQRECLKNKLLEKERANTLGTFEKAELNAKIAFKDTQIKGYKTYIENILLY